MLWLDDVRQAAIERLYEGDSATVGTVWCVGSRGWGRTAWFGACYPGWRRRPTAVVYISNVTVGRRGLLPAAVVVVGARAQGHRGCGVRGGPAGRSATDTREHRVHPVLIIDEAHLLNDATLSHLHILANFEMDSAPLLSMVLVGLPELHDRLKLGGEPLAADADLGRWWTSGATSASDTASYVRSRLESAGASNELFAVGRH